MHLNDVVILTDFIPYYYNKSLEELSGDIKEVIGNKESIIVYDLSLLREDIDTLCEYLGGHSCVKAIGMNVSEKTKNFDKLNEVIEQMIDSGITRDTFIIAVGGGILGNIVGMASGLIYRGINFIHVPTTIIACADSVLSIKQAVNSRNAKNMIGVYYSPVAICTCYYLFRNLSEKQVSAGYVEYVKNMMILTPEIIDLFLLSDIDLSCLSYDEVKELITNSIRAKNKLLKNDPHERKEAVILEYGHTVGHAVEMLTNGQINHGEAVAFGMLVAAFISNKLGFFQKTHIDTLLNLLNKINMIRFIKEKFEYIKQINQEKLRRTLLFDNKRGYISTSNDEVAMVILEDYAKTRYTNEACLIPVNIDTVIECFKSVMQFLLRGDNNEHFTVDTAFLLHS